MYRPAIKSNPGMITPPTTNGMVDVPITPIRNRPPSPDSPLRPVELFGTDDSQSGNEILGATQPAVSPNIEALEVVVCSVEEKVELCQERILSLEKELRVQIDFVNNVIIILIAFGVAHLMLLWF